MCTNISSFTVQGIPVHAINPFLHYFSQKQNYSVFCILNKKKEKITIKKNSSITLGNYIKQSINCYSIKLPIIVQQRRLVKLMFDAHKYLFYLCSLVVFG